MVFLVHFQVSIVDNFSILAYIQALIADNFGISAHIEVLIADDQILVFLTHLGKINTFLSLNYRPQGSEFAALPTAPPIH